MGGMLGVSALNSLEVRCRIVLQRIELSSCSSSCSSHCCSSLSALRLQRFHNLREHEAPRRSLGIFIFFAHFSGKVNMKNLLGKRTLQECTSGVLVGSVLSIFKPTPHRQGYGYVLG